MDVRVLGPVEVEQDGAHVLIDSPKERALLATLALEPGRAVSSTRLVDALWGEDPPETADKTLQWHVSRLRKSMAPETLVTTQYGYALDVDPSWVDATRFRDLVDEAAHLLDAAQPRRAAERLRSALALWRGDPLADLAESDFRVGQQRRFEELHILASERLIEAELQLGNHEDWIPELEALIGEHPYRARLRSLLMLALYRAGRQAEALRAFQRYRTLLREELGIEPDEETSRVEDRILRQDPQLDIEPPPPPHNLSPHLTSFVGRERELRSVRESLEHHRLISLVGAGGIGKSRLAAEASLRLLSGFRDGVWWIDLAAAEPGDALEDLVAVTLGAPLGSALVASDALRIFLRSREALLVLDNCEHVRSEASSLASLLVGAGSGIKVLTTSRAALDVPGEVRIAVGPLPLGATHDRYSAAVRLFLDRSQAVRGIPVPDHEIQSVDTLCRQLDGIPLAIELAAAKAGVLTPDEMARHLLTTVDLPLTAARSDRTRHHSLTHVLDWSYGLLSAHDRTAFDALGVFRGDFDLPAASAVIGADSSAEAMNTVARLLDSSMLVASEPLGETRRFRLLEPMRLYALSHLDEKQLHTARHRHCAHFKSLFGDTDTLRRPDVMAWRRHIWAEDHNLAAAAAWSRGNEEASAWLDFAEPIAEGMYRRGENLRCVDVLLTMLEGAEAAPPAKRAAARNGIIWPALLSGQAPLAFTQVALARQEAVEAGDAYAEAWADWNTAHMLVLGTADYATAAPLYDKAIAVAEADPDRFGTLAGLGYAGRAQARGLADVRSEDDHHHLEVAERRLTMMNDLSGLAHVWMARWIVELRDGRYDAALDAATRNVLLGRASGEPVYEQIGLAGLGNAHLLRSEPGEALDVLFKAVRISHATYNLLQLGVALQGLGISAMALGRWREGATLWGCGITLGAPWPVFLRVHASSFDRCAEALGSDYEPQRDAGTKLAPDEAVALAATIEV